MLINTAIDVRVLPTVVARFTAIVGLDRWKKCVDDLSKWQNRTQLFDDYLEQRHGIELAFERVTQRRRSTGRLIWPPKDISTIRYYNLALTATAVYDRLSVRGKKKLAGMIVNALQSEFGFGPLAFEMQIVTHLMGRGFDVQFNDIEGDGGFDFLATRNGTQVEVECKHVSGDIGRNIHKKRQLVLGEHLLPRLDETIKQLGCGILVEVEMLDKLTGRLDHLEEITRLVISAISSGKETGQVCDVSARKVPFDAQHPAFAKLIAIDGAFVRVTTEWNNPNDFVGVSLLARSHAAYRAGCGNAVGGQVFETFASLRACLEHAGYAALMKHQPALAQVWMDRHQDEASLKAMKQAFTQGNVRDALTALDQKAATVYDRLYQDCIDFGGHPNVLSVAGSMKVDKLGDARVLQIIHLHADGPPLDLGLKSAGRCGVCSLHIFAAIFPDRYAQVGLAPEMARLRQGL
jgi:hypothetical protein